MFSWNTHDALLYHLPQPGFVLEVCDFQHFLSPLLFGKVPDLLNRHVLTRVDAIEDDFDAIFFTELFHLLAPVQ